jgi:hypothetical protein
VSKTVERLIGSFIEPASSIHPLAEIVELKLQKSAEVRLFLSSLQEDPPVRGLRVLRVTENSAECACPFSTKDHESPSYLHSEVRFRVNLADEQCSILPF